MTKSKEASVRNSVNKFIEKTIWKALLANRRRSSIVHSKRKDKVSFLDVFEKALDLFTKKEYKWQIDKTDYVVPYEESLRRILIFLLILTTIVLITCTILTLIVMVVFQTEDNRIVMYDVEIKSNVLL